MQVASYLREHYQTINKVLAEHSQARDAFGLDIKKKMAYMLLAEKAYPSGSGAAHMRWLEAVLRRHRQDVDRAGSNGISLLADCGV